MRRPYLFAAVVIVGIFGTLALLGPGIGVALVTLTGVVGGLVGIGYLQTYYAVWRSDPADLRVVSGSDGAIEVAGPVEPHDDTLDAPFTGSECVLYEVKLIELGMNQAQKRRFRERRREVDTDVYLHSKNYNDSVVATDQRSRPFVVATDTGRALIEPDGGQWEITSQDDVDVQSGEEPPERIANWLDTHPRLDLVTDDERIFRERRLDIGDEVHVYGPIREAGSSFDLPGGVRVVIGRERPGSGSFVVGEDSLSELIDRIRSENRTRFVISTGGEIEAERRLLKTGLFWGGVGAIFFGVGIFLTV